jgi:hypothetical protein
MKVYSLADTKTMQNHKIDERNYFNNNHLDNLHDSADPGIKGIPAIFITTPTINTCDFNEKQNAYFKYLQEEEPDLYASLNYGGDRTDAVRNYAVRGTAHPFITILSNKFVSFSPPSTSSTSMEMSETRYGYKQALPGPIIGSISGGQADIEYVDNRNLDVLKIHKLWVEYIEGVSRGDLKPNSASIIHRMLDYTCSIYYFMLDMDGETILYWSKYTGCSPTNIPYDVFDGKLEPNQTILNYNISYNYSFKEDMDPNTLLDFNAVATSAPNVASFQDGSSVNYNLYTSDPGTPLQGSTGSYDRFISDDLIHNAVPYIDYSAYGDNTKKRYKLKYLSRVYNGK